MHHSTAIRKVDAGRIPCVAMSFTAHSTSAVTTIITCIQISDYDVWVYLNNAMEFIRDYRNDVVPDRSMQ